MKRILSLLLLVSVLISAKKGADSNPLKIKGTVRITDSFYMKITEVTLEEWMDFIVNRDFDCYCTVKSGNATRLTMGKRLQLADWFWPNDNGLYNIQGNASEMTSTNGVAMGGSFRQYAYQTFSDQQQLYSGPEDWLGFRYVVLPKNNYFKFGVE